jgi:hypothetical protein
MTTRDIQCCHCGLKGKLDVSGLEGDVPMPEPFRHLGHNPYSGYMHYLCPSCKAVIDVDPMSVLGEVMIIGRKHSSTGFYADPWETGFLKHAFSHCSP